MAIRDIPVMVTIPCADLDRSRDFYEHKLGLKVSEEAKIEGPEGGVLFECAGTKIYLYKTPAPAGQATVCSFWVDDLEREMADLRSRGVVFEEYDLPQLKTTAGIFTDPLGNRSSWIKDPNGNIIALTHVKAKAMAA